MFVCNVIPVFAFPMTRQPLNGQKKNLILWVKVKLFIIPQYQVVKLLAHVPVNYHLFSIWEPILTLQPNGICCWWAQLEHQYCQHLKRHKRETWDGNTGDFSSLIAWSYKTEPVCHWLRFIYGKKSIEKRHISICFFSASGESHLCIYLSFSQPLDQTSGLHVIKMLIISFFCAMLTAFPM